MGCIHVDRDLAPFVKKSFVKHFVIAIAKQSDDFINLNIDSLEPEELDEWIDNNKKKYLNSLNLKEENIYIDNKDNLDSYLYQSALFDLYKEGTQAAQALYHNLNTLESRQGSQVPFTSINLGKDTSSEGRLVTKWLMQASLDGIGDKHITSIFPISIFQYKKGINSDEGDKNYDLKKLALKSMSKRIYPNWCNCDWSEAHESPDDPNTDFSTMGCLDGDEIVTYKIFDKLYVESFETMWDRMSSSFEVMHQYNEDNPNLYIDLENAYIYDTKLKDFTVCKRIIRNVSNSWCIVNIDGGKRLLCTNDHPFETENRGVVKAEDLLTSDQVLVNNTQYGEDISCADIEIKNITSVEKINRTDYSYDVTTESEHFEVSGVYSHNCRTLVGYDRHGLGYIRVGRGNNVPNTIILPKLGIEYGICLGKRTEPDLEGFWKAFNETLELCEYTLLERFKIMCEQSPSAAPFMYDNNTIKGARDCKDNVYNALKHNTLAIGYIGIAEMCQALFGKNHAEDPDVHKFALNVVKRINEFAKEASERNDLNFSCYATPAEGLCSTALKALRKQYGIIDKVTSNDFLTNSHHVPVWEKVSIYDKLRIEAPFCKYPTGGCITYIELDSTFVKNTKAIEDIIRYAFEELDIPYLAFNFPIDTCMDCGFQGEFNNVCPTCGSSNILQLRRVTGYLTLDWHNFNAGKQAEVQQRVKHSAYTNFTTK